MIGITLETKNYSVVLFYEELYCTRDVVVEVNFVFD